MKGFVEKIKGKNFFQNVVVIASGTAAAQVLTFLFSPILTRLYGPEAFGILGTFMAIVAIISPLAALTYPFAIVLPKQDEDARMIIKISIVISIIFSFFVAVLIILFGENIISYFDLFMISNFLYLIPFVIIFAALLEVSQNWLIRTKQFAVTGKSALINALIVNVSKAGLGLINPVASVLVFMSVLGTGLHALLMIKGSRASLFQKKSNITEQNNSIELVKTYKDFPIFRAPQTFIHVTTQNLPILLLGVFFGATIAGFYSLSRSVLGKPIQIFGKAVGDVFYSRINDASKSDENLSRLIIKATLLLTMLGSIPFGIIILFGSPIFGAVFGEEWQTAGKFASWIAIGSFCVFINRPAVMAIPVLNIQKDYFYYEVMSSVFRIGLLFIGVYVYKDALITIMLFSSSSALVNMILIMYTVIKAKSFRSHAIY